MSTGSQKFKNFKSVISVVMNFLFVLAFGQSCLLPEKGFSQKAGFSNGQKKNEKMTGSFETKFVKVLNTLKLNSCVASG